MAVRGYFYNSVKFDRPYNGEDMNEDKAPFYKEGVVYGHLEVKAREGMTVTVDGGTKTGYAYINMHTIHNTTVLPLTVSQASGTLPRIDRVVLRNDQTERKPSIFILEGAYSSNPQPTALTNNDVIQEKCLAEITVNAGAVEITDADIKDTRADPDLCGFIASQFVDIDFAQFTRQFDSFFAKYQEKILTDYEQYLQNIDALIDKLKQDGKGEYDELISFLSNLADKVQEEHDTYLSNLQTFYEEIETKGQQRYDTFNANITAYIKDLENRGETNLAAITQQLLDFRNTNEAVFLEFLEEMKDKLREYPLGKFQIQFDEMKAQQEEMLQMLMTGMVTTNLITDEGDYIVDDMGNALLVGWPICKCN